MDKTPGKYFAFQYGMESYKLPRVLGGAGETHAWTAFVKPLKGQADLWWVDHVVFHLHESFVPPVESVSKPPFEIHKKGWGAFTLFYVVWFKYGLGKWDGQADVELSPIEDKKKKKLYTAITVKPKIPMEKLKNNEALLIDVCHDWLSTQDQNGLTVKQSIKMFYESTNIEISKAILKAALNLDKSTQVPPSINDEATLEKTKELGMMAIEQKRKRSEESDGAISNEDDRRQKKKKKEEERAKGMNKSLVKKKRKEKDDDKDSDDIRAKERMKEKRKEKERLKKEQEGKEKERVDKDKPEKNKMEKEKDKSSRSSSGNGSARSFVLGKSRNATTIVLRAEGKPDANLSSDGERKSEGRAHSAKLIDITALWPLTETQAEAFRKEVSEIDDGVKAYHISQIVQDSGIQFSYESGGNFEFDIHELSEPVLKRVVECVRAR